MQPLSSREVGRMRVSLLTIYIGCFLLCFAAVHVSAAEKDTCFTCHDKA